MSAIVCPFSRLSISGAERPVKDEKSHKDGGNGHQDCKSSNKVPAESSPRQQSEKSGDKPDQIPAAEVKMRSDLGRTPGPKCPLGYDSASFKIGPLSCVICRALLFNTCRCVPCEHIFCRGCISQFQDCPLCGVDIKNIEPDHNLQQLVDQFIEGHGRIKRSAAGTEGTKDVERRNEVIYEDVSLARGTFLLQHAMRAFQAKNLDSAKARLALCVEDTADEFHKDKSNQGVSSQLGAVLGMLGDCCRAMGEIENAKKHYERSVKLLEDVPTKDSEMVHALSVSLNKLGDLQYYADELGAAREYYKRALSVRRSSVKELKLPSAEVLDVAVSLAKIADVDRALGEDEAAVQGFKEGIKLLEGISFSTSNEDSTLEERWKSVLQFLHSQVPTQL
eukprot:TRINITY_DN8385_c0_g1_i1.p1 TRINITY_DN8385_c0_g1~~TRINITY_DN8385_c0_g1_i1.p1  ORF type:complete len:392 (+),score=68.62 TRINITY_DN8385_c0_g1_i1:190-1365(+)